MLSDSGFRLGCKLSFFVYLLEYRNTNYNYNTYNISKCTGIDEEKSSSNDNDTHYSVKMVKCISSQTCSYAVYSNKGGDNHLNSLPPGAVNEEQGRVKAEAVRNNKSSNG